MSEISTEEACARSLFEKGEPVRDVRRVAEALGLDVEKTVRHYRDLQNARMQAPSEEPTPGNSKKGYGMISWRNGTFEHFVKWFDECRAQGCFPDDYKVSFKIAHPKAPKPVKCTTCNDTGLYTITGDSCYAGEVHACPGACKASRKYR